MHVLLAVFAVNCAMHRVALRLSEFGRDIPAGRTRRDAAASRSSVSHPLAEDDRLLAAGGHFFQVGLQPLELGAFAGGRIEVANLLQPQHQLEHVLDRELARPVRVSRSTPSFFGQVVGLALLRREVRARRRETAWAASRSAPGPSSAAECTRPPPRPIARGFMSACK